MQTLKVWDWPTRLFHWLLVITVTAALLSGWLGGKWIDWHAFFGLSVAGLLAFRLAWGFLGSTYARFSAILCAPLQCPAYLRGQWHGAGHNPLGSLSVLAILAILIFQVVTGLFATDDISFSGPLYKLIGSSTSATVSTWHRLGMWVVLAIIALHLLAIGWYTFVKRQPLVKAMITGVMPRESSSQKDAKGGGWIALILALIFAAAVVWVANGSWISVPPPLPSTMPAW